MQYFRSIKSQSFVVFALTALALGLTAVSPAVADNFSDITGADIAGSSGGGSQMDM